MSMKLKWLRKWRPLGLRMALVAYVVAPLAALVFLCGFVGLRVLEGRIEKRMQEDVELVARAIQPALSRALERDRKGVVSRALQAAFSIDRVFGVYVYDSDGNRIATAGGPGALDSRRDVSRLVQEGDRKGEYGEVAGRYFYSYFVPLTDSGARIIGLLQVSRRASDFESYIGSLRWAVGAVSVVALGLMTVLVLFGHHGAIGRDLERLIGSMKAVESGDRKHRALQRGPREIAQVAESLNAMLDSIQAAEEQIARHREAKLALQFKLRQTEKLAVIGQLAAGVAHELGAPLSVIDGKARRTLRSSLDPKAARDLIEVRGEVRRMGRILRQLLDFGGGRPLKMRRVSADRLAHSSLSLLGREEDRGKPPVTVAGPHPPPELSVDPFRFEQALVNLLRNARQAAPGGRVQLTWFEDGRSAGFVIEDDGPGIPECAKERLLDPFFTTKAPGEGTGLGLALVQSVVQEHKGSLFVGKSRLGGALFRVTLPLSGESRGCMAPIADSARS